MTTASSGTDETEEPERTRVWMVERTYSSDAPNILVITYATADGSRYLVQERAANQFLTGNSPTVTAARDVDPAELSPTDDRATEERYAAEAERMRQRHDPADPV